MFVLKRMSKDFAVKKGINIIVYIGHHSNVFYKKHNNCIDELMNHAGTFSYTIWKQRTRINQNSLPEKLLALN